MNMDLHRGKGNFSIATLTSGEPLTMSSREIAELVEARHDSVKRTIERLAEKGVIIQPPSVDEQDVDAMGRKRATSVYYLEKRDSFVVVAQLSPEFTARLVDRWQELEEQKANGTLSLPNFADPAAAARAWADQVETATALKIENAAKDEVIEAMQPKVSEYDAWLSEDGVSRIMHFCNKHGVKKNHPGYVLRAHGYMHQKKVIATQSGVRVGLLRNVLNKDGFEYIDSKGNSVESEQAMVVNAREVMLLRMIVDAYGLTAFRNAVAFERAKLLIGGVK